MIGSTKIDLEGRIHANKHIMAKKSIEIEKAKIKKTKKNKDAKDSDK
jgi:hypothetical protein